MHRLPTRVVDGHWEVQIPVDNHSAWIRCDSQQEAHRMSNAGNLAFDAIERNRVGEEIAKELEEAAHLFLKYQCKSYDPYSVAKTNIRFTRWQVFRTLVSTAYNLPGQRSQMTAGQVPISLRLSHPDFQFHRQRLANELPPRRVKL